MGPSSLFTAVPLLLLVAALAPACTGEPAPLADLLCNRDTDCPSAMACQGGRCVEVPDPDCTLAEQCTSPRACQDTAGARCIAGRCHYPPRVCDTPPPNSCVTADGPFLSYPTVGLCDPGTDACVYEAREIACPNCATACLAACSAVTCPPLAGGCQRNGACLPGPPASCDYEQAPDGTACTQPQDVPPEQTGVCNAGLCGGCVWDEDCPGVPAECNDLGPTTTCQGVAGHGLCIDAACQVDLRPDDSACAGAVRTCPNNLKPIACTAEPDQPTAACPTSCAGNGDCVDGFACAGGQCTCRIGDPCDDGDDCTYDDACTTSGTCAGTPVTDHGGCQNDSSPCTIKYFCRNAATCGMYYPGSETSCSLTDVCAVNPHCNGGGSCVSDPCAGGNVCYPSFGCLPAPTFSVTATGACFDLRVAHAGTTALYVVTGPPGAHVVKYNRNVGCGQAGHAPADETPTSPGAAGAKFIDGAGNYTYLLGNAPVTNCEGGSYGRWDSYATVDGVATNHAESSVYNSGCWSSPPSRNLTTCAAVANYCSPCGLFGCPDGQYCDHYSGGTPVCRAPWFEPKPTCADVGVGHPGTTWFGDILAGYRVHGPEGARVHKFNLHQSCAGASWGEALETTEAARYIDSSGYYELIIGGLPAFSCGDLLDMMGSWASYATVGGDDTPQFPTVSTGSADGAYFNSQCGASGYGTCNAAQSYCYY